MFDLDKMETISFTRKGKHVRALLNYKCHFLQTLFENNFDERGFTLKQIYGMFPDKKPTSIHVQLRRIKQDWFIKAGKNKYYEKAYFPSRLYYKYLERYNSFLNKRGTLWRNFGNGFNHHQTQI